MAKKHTGTASIVGWFAFGFTCCHVMMLLLYPDITGLIGKMTVWWGGYAMLGAGFIEIYREDVFHGTLFGGYANMWLAIADGAGSQMFYCVYGFFTLSLLVVAMRKTPALIAWLTAFSIALFMLAFAKNDYALRKGGRWLAFWVGIGAWVLGLSTVIEWELGFVFPGFRPVPEWFPFPHYPGTNKSKKALKAKTIKKKCSFDRSSTDDMLPTQSTTDTFADLMAVEHSIPIPAAPVKSHDEHPWTPAQTPAPAASPDKPVFFLA